MKLHALTSGHRPSLFGAWLHFEVSFVVWLLIGALGVVIAQDFALSATQKGFLVAVPLLSGALLRPVVGPCADRFGAKRVGLGILGAAGAALLCGWLFGHSYARMVGVGLLLGSAGASFAIALPIASRAYPPRHQGLAMGIAATGNSGGILAVWLAPRLAEQVGWHGVFGLMLVPVVLTAAVFAMVVRDRAPAAGGGGPSFRILCRERDMRRLCGFYAVTFGGFVGFSSFLPIWFHDQYGLDVMTAGAVTALCAAAGSLARPAGGYAADRGDGSRLLCGGLLGAGGLCLFLACLPPVFWAAPAAVAALCLLGFGNGVVFQTASMRYLDSMGTASGLIGAAGGLGGFVLPFGFGLFRDVTGTFASGFLLFALLAGVAAWRANSAPGAMPDAGHH